MDFTSDVIPYISRHCRGRTSDSGRLGTIAPLDAATERLSLASEPQTRLIVPPAVPSIDEKRRVSHPPSVVRKHKPKHRPTGPYVLPSPSSKQKSKSKAKDGDTIPRPPNAFILFRSTNKDGFSGLQKDISRAAGKKWGGMSDKEKEPFHEMAAQAKREHKEKYPEYKYTPAEKGSKLKKAKMIDEGLEEFEYPVSASASASASASTSTSGSGYPSPSSSASVIPSSPELMTPPLFSSSLINPDEMVVDVDVVASLGTTSALDEVAKCVDFTSFLAPLPGGFQFDETAFLDIYKGGMDLLLPPVTTTLAGVEEYPVSMSGINDFNIDVDMNVGGSGGFDDFNWAGMCTDLRAEGFVPQYGFDSEIGFGFGM